MRELRKSVTENPTGNASHTIQTDNPKKRHLVRRLFLFFLITFAIVAGVNLSFYKNEQSVQEKQKEIKKLSAEMTALKEKEALLKDEITKLNDDEYIAKIARRDYFFSKKGEKIYPVE